MLRGLEIVFLFLLIFKFDAQGSIEVDRNPVSVKSSIATAFLSVQTSDISFGAIDIDSDEYRMNSLLNSASDGTICTIADYKYTLNPGLNYPSTFYYSCDSSPPIGLALI